MPRARPLFLRVASAVITAAGVVLLAAGLLTVAAPASGSPGTTVPPSSAAVGTPGPTTSGGPSGSTASPSPSAVPGTAAPTRIVVAALRIDLPVLSSNYPGGTTFPLCNVAQYYDGVGLAFQGTDIGLPGNDGRSVYVYAHARTGMFLPLLTASLTANGDSMKGDLVQVYTDDDLVYTYVVSQVKRHAQDFTIAESVPADGQQVVLQTSETSSPTGAKLQVAATFVTVAPTDHATAHPTPHPLVCS